MIGSILTVTQVNTFIKSLIEGDGRLQDFFLSGEISNFTNHYKSGHLYLSLKDPKSVLKAVMFAGAARRLKFKPKDGMRVIVRGRVSVYEPSGQYQLYIEDMQPDGVGAAYLAFEQLKEKLEAEGLFGDEFKKPIPVFPEKIGVVTSATGAAVRDILQITARRWPAAEIILAPVLVQGTGAAEQITDALNKMNALHCCNVIIVGRGGGSIEDLQAFNDEALARAVFASEIPVVSAVGHETDFTICDFVADLRAPTPSAAAELCTPDIENLREHMTVYNQSFRLNAMKMVEYLKQSIDFMIQDSIIQDPAAWLKDRREEIDAVSINMHKGLLKSIGDKKLKLSFSDGQLQLLNPARLLKRGYTVVADEATGQMIRSINQIKPGDRLTLSFADGAALTEVKGTESGDIQ